MTKVPTALGSATWKLADKRRRQASLTPALLGEELYLAERIRTGLEYQQRRNVHGLYWVSATRTHVWHESMLERSALMRLDFAGDVAAIAAQPMLLTVGDWSHYPDYLVLHRDGTQTLIDVKPASRVDEHRSQFERTATVCEAKSPATTSSASKSSRVGAMSCVLSGILWAPFRRLVASTTADAMRKEGHSVPSTAHTVGNGLPGTAPRRPSVRIGIRGPIARNPRRGRRLPAMLLVALP